MRFEELNLRKDIVEQLNSLGFETPTEVQQKTIPLLLEKKDIVGRSETGSGKTFAFALPIIQNVDINCDDLQALVVCPTRELAMQVADEFKKITEALNVKVCAVFGGSNITRQITALKRNPSILIGTPGRLIDLINRKSLFLQEVKTVVLDEADEMLDMGFREDIEKILKQTKKERQTVLFSATIPDEIKEIINNYQKDSVLVEIGEANKALDKIEQAYLFVNQKRKQDCLKELFSTDIFGKTIVFVNTKKYAEELEHFLNKSKIYAKALHGDMRQSERKRVITGFKGGDFDILIATDVAARGLDIKEVKYVVNYDIPNQLEYYVHRIGRTARAGESGQVVNLITNISQLSNMREIEKITKAKIKVYETQNEFILTSLTDTKKLAKENSRFANKNRFSGLKDRFELPEYSFEKPAKKSIPKRDEKFITTNKGSKKTTKIQERGSKKTTKGPERKKEKANFTEKKYQSKNSTKAKEKMTNKRKDKIDKKRADKKSVDKKSVEKKSGKIKDSPKKWYDKFSKR